MSADVEPLYATILILVVTGQRIYLAADSRSTYLDVNGIQKRGTIQKIHELNGYYYAISGFYEDKINGFSIANFLRTIFATTVDPELAIKQMATQLAPALKDYLKLLQTTKLLQQLKTTTGSGGEIVILKIRDNQPAAYLLEYQFAEQAGDIKVIVKSWSTDTSSIKEKDSCFYRLIGNISPASVSRFTEKQWAATPIENSYWVLQQGQNAFPDFVGAPFTIVSISATEVLWF